MKFAIVVGTRPEIIKMAPVIRECQSQGIDLVLIHSNQHYSENMDKVFFEELGLPAPRYNLNVGSGTHSNQVGNILIKIEPILEKERPTVLLVQGDTNTVVAAAMAAHKLGIKVGHVEAGLRSYDRTMPEESNRVITDHISDLLFAVTQTQRKILQGEGITDEKIIVVGNTIVDAVFQNLARAEKKSRVLHTLGVEKNKYALFTSHRAGNVDNATALREVLEILASIPFSVVWPIHVRTRKKIEEFDLKIPANVKVSEPLGYLDFLQLQKNAKVIVTDSGGIQEEACILGVPCITIRENTERPETLDVGANILVGRDLKKFKEALNHNFTQWKSPFGDGQSARMIVRATARALGIAQAQEKISVIGMGYMGIPTALMLAESGYTVSGYDIDSKKVSALNSGQCPIEEPGMPELLEKVRATERFQATTQLQPSSVYIVAVPTPHHDRKCDLSYVLAACKSVAQVAKDGDLLIVESTIKPGTCRDHVAPLFSNLNVEIVHCPERAIPGNTLHEIRHNDRIIGGLTTQAAQRTREIYESFVKGEIFLTDVTTAEAVKLMENTFRDVNIALANELSMIAEELGFNVWEAIRLANRHPRVNILQPGPGVGGHCIAIDPWFLTEDTQANKLITAAREVNDGMPDRIVERFVRMMGGKTDLRVGVLGLAYKKNVDDARETPAEHILHALKNQGYIVKAHDPFIKDWPSEDFESDGEKLEAWADAFLLVTDHDVFRSFQTSKPILDTRNFFA